MYCEHFSVPIPQMHMSVCNYFIKQSKCSKYFILLLGYPRTPDWVHIHVGPKRISLPFLLGLGYWACVIVHAVFYPGSSLSVILTLLQNN